MKTIANLGINIVNLKIEEAVELGIGRVEVCLGSENLYAEKIEKFYRRINRAQERGLPYSIHLPVYIENWYPHNYFSAFFIDKDRSMRELSFRLLEVNLEKLKNLRPDYFVLHFPGICEKWEDHKEFLKILKKSLTRIDNLANNYGVRIYLEYFGSNDNFWSLDEWISYIGKYDNLGILTDTGHLYFASVIQGFDFMEALETLAPNSKAFHLWTTKGDKAYCQSEYYKKYHHIGPHIEQLKADGWAFNTGEVVELIAKQKKPIIIEPSIKYKGKEYLIEGIKSIHKFLK
ncbi:MAG: sugar phosphate isomerase/epimerase [Clostridia bacterium]|nr:sugar phosphate isomerase/epimerase [Clostridia bacterium]